MVRNCVALWLCLGLAGSAAADDVPPSSAQVTSKADALPPVPKDAKEKRVSITVGKDIKYLVETKVLEGLGLPEEGAKKPADLPRVQAALGDGAAGGVTPQPAAQTLPPPSATRATAKAPPDPLWDAFDNRTGITLLASTKIITSARQPGTIQLQSQNKTSLTYLEPLGAGKYMAKQTAPQELGMTFTFQVKPIDGADDRVELSPLEGHLSSLDGREPVDGLDLEVGKPIIATRSLKTSTTMKLGVPRLIVLPSGAKTRAALFLRVTAAPEY